MSKPYPALCRDCKHSKPEADSEWFLRCTHPKVNANDPWALSSGGKIGGSECRSERMGGLLSRCGKRGRLWEPKDAAPSGATGG